MGQVIIESTKTWSFMELADLVTRTAPTKELSVYRLSTGVRVQRLKQQGLQPLAVSERLDLDIKSVKKYY